MLLSWHKRCLICHEPGGDGNLPVSYSIRCVYALLEKKIIKKVEGENTTASKA